MAHNLEILEDGTASMFSGEGITPWHQLGTVIDGLATAEEAMQLAHLDWEVEMRQSYYPIYEPDEDGHMVERLVPDDGQFTTVRVTDQKPLGRVAKGYTIFQNRAAFGFFDDITDSGEAKYTAAGALKGGKSVFLTAKIGDTLTCAGDDAHDLYLLLTNSHAGKESLTAATTVVRAVCDNTVTLGLRTAKTKWTIRHRSTLEGKVQEAREALKLSFKYADAFQREVENLMQVQVNKDQFNKMVEKLIKPSKTQHDKDVAALMDIFENEKTVNDTNAKGTGWGAFNAITFFGDHRKKYHTPESRFNSLNDGFAEKLRNDAHGMILAMA